MSGGSDSGTQTVTQTQQIPQFEQDFAQANQNIAASLGSTPYPSYKGQLVSPMNAYQTTGMQQASDYSRSADAGINAGQATTNGALQSYLNPNLALFAGANVPQIDPRSAFTAYGQNPGVGASQTFGAAGGQTFNNADIGGYMSPYIMQSLDPQLQQLSIQQGRNQKAIDASATMHGAFGDARNGVESALNNYYGNVAQNGIIGQGYNNAFTNAQGAFQNDQSRQLQAYQTGLQGQQYEQNLGQTAFGQASQASLGQQAQDLNQVNAAQSAGQNQQGIQLQGGAQQGNLASLYQQTGLNGAQALYGAGAQQQTQAQNENNAAYQQFQNQVNWPIQMLNLRSAALTASPYNVTSAMTVPGGNAAAQNIGLFGQLAGGVGALTSGGNRAPYGGQAYNSATGSSNGY